MDNYTRNAIDVMSMRITELKEELAQITDRRNKALEIIEDYRQLVRELRDEISKLEK